ncbi:DNA topoisomerase VI subunit B [Candidatus Bathyarchaeota archaeon]|nr:DNA topoisomerase VI subunit B [Candidatus Bathyarchaeota archaeon]
MSLKEVFQEITPSDFFYRNRDIAGFTNPARALYSTVRELVENSLDACELSTIPPEIYIRISNKMDEEEIFYQVRIEDNGPGVPPEIIPSAFGQILFGSKYKLRQTRGTFGLGGKMALLYGQITTNGTTLVISSVDGNEIYEYQLMIDIKNNKPIILSKKNYSNKRKWHGTILEFTTEADYPRAASKIIEYLKQTAIVVPYANITFVDPKGKLYKFTRVTTKMPKPPEEARLHPHGVDVETLRRLIEATKTKTLHDFIKTHFQRVGDATANSFLKFANIDLKKNPKQLSQEDIVKLTNALKSFNEFLPPDAGCLSPIGEELLKIGIKKELNPEFVTVYQRKPSTYSGFPFIVEVGMAYGGGIPKTGKIELYRFANKIPLLFDEASDVSWKVINTLIDWRRYKIPQDAPIAIFIHICSTKVPYKTVGKEFIADRPEVEREILNAVREVARRLSLYLSKKRSIEREKKRFGVFAKYLPKIALFSTKLSEKKKEPEIKTLLKKASKIEEEFWGSEEEKRESA